METQKHYNITISGMVQGVGFRYNARTIAQYIGINGFVKNIPGNKVYIETEGTESELSEFINWCHKGPGYAHIEKVDVEPGEMEHFKSFEILR
jgi:acylphosphatase